MTVISLTAIKHKTEAISPLESIFPCAAARIVDSLFMMREMDLSESAIAKNTGLSKRTVSHELKRLSKGAVVKLSRKIGRANMYKVVHESYGVRGLQRYYDEKLLQNAEKYQLNITGEDLECNITGEDLESDHQDTRAITEGERYI